MKRFAILASGNGSNAEHIVRFFRENGNAEVACIITNRPDAYVLTRAESLGIPSKVFARDSFASGLEILAFLEKQGVVAIVLAGFLLKIPQLLIDAFPGRIINIHPALLPKHGGKGMYGMKVHEAVINSGDRHSGISIHLVNAHYDEGEILLQMKCEVKPDDDPVSLAARIHELEYCYYPPTIARFLDSF